MVTTVARVQARLDSQIRIIRGRQVMLDDDLSSVYGVSTSALNQALKRNRTRFPLDFAFQLSAAESNLRSQSVISSSGHGGRRSRPWAYTEHGVLMAASVLNSRRAIDTSVYVVRAFIRLREAAALHARVLLKLKAIERKVGEHDEDLKEVFTALRRIVSPPAGTKRAIGFQVAGTSSARAAPRLRDRGRRTG